MIIMLQSTDPERLNNEGSKGDTWVFLGRGNRKDFASALGAVVNGNKGIGWQGNGRRTYWER